MGLKRRCRKCSKEKQIRFFNIARNTCRSCSKKEYKDWSKRYYCNHKQTVDYKYLRLKTGSKQRNIYLDITKEQFIDIISNKCEYCGDNNRIGLDRIDSLMGYTLDNIVPCCYRCNVAKNNMEVEEFIKHCKRIVDYYDTNASTTDNSEG